MARPTFPPDRAFGALMIEWFRREYIRLCEPTMFSYDHYPVQVGTAEPAPANGPALAVLAVLLGLHQKP